MQTWPSKFFHLDKVTSGLLGAGNRPEKRLVTYLTELENGQIVAESTESLPPSLPRGSHGGRMASCIGVCRRAGVWRCCATQGQIRFSQLLRKGGRGRCRP